MYDSIEISDLTTADVTPNVSDGSGVIVASAVKPVLRKPIDSTIASSDKQIDGSAVQPSAELSSIVSAGRQPHTDAKKVYDDIDVDQEVSGRRERGKGGQSDGGNGEGNGAGGGNGEVGKAERGYGRVISGEEDNVEGGNSKKCNLGVGKAETGNYDSGCGERNKAEEDRSEGNADCDGYVDSEKGVELLGNSCDPRAKRKRALQGHSIRRPGPTQNHLNLDPMVEVFPAAETGKLRGFFSPEEKDSVLASVLETKPTCCGSMSAFVTLVAEDDHEFIIFKEAARVSRVIERILDESVKFAEDEVQEIRFPQTPSHVLHVLALFMMYVIEIRRKNCMADPQVRALALPEFVWDDKHMFGVLQAAYFLEM
ncbi:uncharacterized protein LOC108667221 [Hyalella azteca]|uniref:Uncharacterized protein LOC108667221 n=1 Tax=Hyalella azteca TaxID=294128 RepID=A0A8B7N8Z9_HYAAZ|nr:uncharacterized protein LOC108667221 [Hyalella azteca]